MPNASERISQADNLTEIRFKKTSTPAAPPTGYAQLSFDSNGLPVWVDAGGTVYSFAAPPPLGVTTPNTIAATAISASGDITLTRTANDAHFYIKANAGQYREVNFQTGSEPRWVVGTDNAAESGALAGTNFKITSFDDDGLNALDRLTINRATGAMVLSDSVSINGAPGTLRLLNFTSSGLTRWTARANAVAESGANVGSDLAISRYNDAGTVIDSPLIITRSTGVTALTNLGIGGGTLGSSAVNVIMLKNGTAPGSSPADSVQLYAEDVTGSSELKVRDEAGNITPLSPHNPQMVDTAGRVTDWVHRERNVFAGYALEADLYGALLALEGLTGQTFIHIAALPDDERENWDANEQLKVGAALEAQAAYDALPLAERPAAPPPGYEHQPAPPRLADQQAVLNAYLEAKRIN